VKVVSTTLCYPNSRAPTQGIFVQRRLSEIARLIPLDVVVPVPWFPIWLSRGFDERAGPEMNPPVKYVRMPYLPGLIKSQDAWFYGCALEWALRRQQYDLIDAHFEWPDGVGAWRVARKRRRPLICTLRGKLVSQAKEPAKRVQIQEMLLGAAGLIAVSKSLAELANQVAGRDLRIHVIPNGVDTSVFRPMNNREALREALGWRTNARYVVSVGHVQELKGFHRLVEVWPDVRRRSGDVRLVLVGGVAGEPVYVGRLKRMIRAMGLKEVVTMAGPVLPNQVAELLNAADLFALASRSEGWCNAIAEALACGCPVLATDVGGNRELIDHPESGSLVPFGNREALLEGICCCLGADWDRPMIAEKGGRRTWQQVARECVDVFKSVLHG